MFPAAVNDGEPSVSAAQQQQQQQQQYQQQQYQQHGQHGQQYQQSDSPDRHPQLLHHHQAQHEAMRLLQQQHILPSIVAPKQDHLAILQNTPSGPWSSDDYDSMMRTILDATLPSDHFTDLEASASLASFSASYAGSFVSGSSDSGASPNSINDLVYGAANFPTPPASDIGSSARNLSLSLASHNSSAFSPDGSFDLSTASYAPSYSGSDATSPFAHNLHVQASSSTSPFGLQPVHLPNVGNNASPIAASHLNDLSASVAQQWDPNFLVPTAAGLQPPSVSQPSQQDPSLKVATDPSPAPPVHVQVNDAAGTNRKRRARETSASDLSGSKPKTSAKKAAAAPLPHAESTDATRKTKKVRATTSPLEPELTAASTATPINQLSSKLPHMEVGSNATALAAIARLKAKRLQETQAAAKAASTSVAAQGSSQTSGAATAADKSPLDPATRQQKKVAHNAIERRYRNNINDRIAALRRAVPALREIRPRKTPSGRRSRKAQQEEDLVDGVPAATKLNKATILGKATDYIKYLKSRELRLTSEVAGLRELVRSLEGGEELLELWEAEMDKVVAEQEALAAAAAAKEEEEAEEASGNAEIEDEDDEEEDEENEDEGDTAESSYASTSSSSPPSARARTGRRGGRGRQSGIGGALSSVASSRLMLATFLGISFIGSGTEFALDATASTTSQAVARPAANKVMFGASRQLLKRSATYMAPDTSVAQDPHAFDIVPTHVLLFEVLRIVSFAFCFLFLVWPLFSRLFFRSRSGSSSGVEDDADTQDERGRAGQSRKLRLALTQGDIDVANFDMAVRTHIDAPISAALAMPSVAMASSRLALSRLSRIDRLLPAQRLSSEEAAALGRLVEVETLCEGKAQPSSLLRLHTALRLANSDYVRGARIGSATRDPVMSTPRLKATLALSFARLGEGINFVQDLADQLWTEARTSLRVASVGAASNQSETTSPSAFNKDEGLLRSEDASWLSSVLSLDLDSALDLLASTTLSTDVRDCDFSAVLAIADAHYCSRLADVWDRLLVSLIEASCPSTEPHSSSLVREFVNLQAQQTLDLDVVRDAEKRKELHAEITFLARTAPPTARAWQLAQVTLATWSAALGNLALARHVASILHEHPFSVDGNVKLASLGTLHSVVDLGVESSRLYSTSVVARDRVDARADLFLSWLGFLRTCADGRTEVKDLHSATLQIRKLVAAVTSSCAASTALEGARREELEACLDHVTDLCTALGRRINLLPDTTVSSSSPSAVKLLLEVTYDEDRDSGVEV